MRNVRYERCEVAEIRGCVEKQLLMLPARKMNEETPGAFWSR
jgi:hypothetical protein